ncbi:hypothetical protein [Stieleria neptunia]|uniref:hypothetical protein n=1 Tax=Stieleria neptunia TaxID=2527979 RepID=UPI0011A72D99|nr:hypothetical protein [Stieleria neptunia]
MVLSPFLLYVATLLIWGFSGVTEFVGQLDDELGVLIHAVPVIWVLFTPLFLVPGAFARPKKPIVDHYQAELADRHSPGEVSMATGAHNSRRFDVRGVDERVVLTGMMTATYIPATIRLDAGDDHYEVAWDRVSESDSFFSADRYGVELRVYRRDANTDRDDGLLMQYARSSSHSDPHLITFPDAADLWLKPNPPCAFPKRYDMVVDDDVIGQIVMPGKFLFCGVMVATSHYRSNVRALLAALCYQMMRN